MTDTTTDTTTTASNDSDSEASFFTRADAHIFLSNDQLDSMHKEGVAASMLYASARFTAWLVASSFTGSAQMEESKTKAVEFFTERFRDMLTQNMDDYSTNFDQYIKTPPQTANDPE
ncbi:MAG: hypothetical protein RL497_1448 [Pseudomonadota bacterium]|jgi:hypothetical protein